MRDSDIRVILLTTLTLFACGTSSAAEPQVLTSFPSSFPSPDGLVWDGEFLWATDCGSPRIDKVDPATGDVVSSVTVDGINSDELAFDGQHLWISDHTATEMPGMGAPPPRIYRIDRKDGSILRSFAPPGDDARGTFPMGMAWDGKNLWNIDTYDGKIFKLDPGDGSVLGSIPAPASGSCGMTHLNGCLWVSDASTDGLVYHLDAATGDVLSTFPGPGGAGHQATGIAWDGTNLWVHDEQVSNPRIYKLTVADTTEGGRCAPPPVNDAGTQDVAGEAGVDTGSTSPDASDQPDGGHETHHADGGAGAGVDGTEEESRTDPGGCSCSHLAL